MDQSKSSDSGVFLWLTYHTLNKMNLDANRIFSQIRLSEQPPDRTIRRDNSTQQRFWEIAEEISADQDIGLHVGEHFPIFRGEILEYIFMSSPTFGDGLQRALRYQKIFTDAFVAHLHIENQNAMITNLQHPVRHYLECAISVMLNFLNYISNNHFHPKEIWLPYQEGASLDEYQRIWKCPTRLGMQYGCIIFDAEILSLASASAEPMLLKIHEHVAKQQVKVVDKYYLINDIENLLSSGLLESGQLDLKLIAQHLGLQPRKLRADLKEVNTTFEKVLATYREKMAKKLLMNPNISIDQVVYLLGFSEPSAFSRAFKRWTNETPSHYRQRKQK